VLASTVTNWDSSLAQSVTGLRSNFLAIGEELIERSRVRKPFGQVRAKRMLAENKPAPRPAKFMKYLILIACLLVQLFPEMKAANLERSLLAAVDQGDLAAAKKSLEQGAKVDARNDKGRTALSLAVSAGQLQIIKALVEKGADVNARTPTETGSTVLAFAVRGKNLEVISYLLVLGAEVDLKGRNGATPLCHAAARGETDIVELLISKGADPNLHGIYDSTGNYETPLMAAAGANHLDTVSLLLSKGAQIDKRTNKGCTPLMEAAKRPYPAIIKLFIEKGANVNARGSHGHTALIFAAYNGNTENVKLLLAAGADPLATATDDADPDKEHGRYGPEVVAAQQGHTEALALIVDAQKSIRATVSKP